MITPTIENGKWKIFDKTYREQTEADRIIFEGFFNTIKKHTKFLENEQCTNTLSKQLLDTEIKKTSLSLKSKHKQIKKPSKKPIYHKVLEFIHGKSLVNK